MSGMLGPDCTHSDSEHRWGLAFEIIQWPGHAHVGCAASAMLAATRVNGCICSGRPQSSVLGALSRHMQAVQHCSCIGTGSCWFQGCEEAWIGSPERFVSMTDAEWPCKVRLISLLSMRGGNLGSFICSASHAGQRSDCQTQPELLAYIAAMTAVFSDLEIACGLHALLQWR